MDVKSRAIRDYRNVPAHVTASSVEFLGERVKSSSVVARAARRDNNNNSPSAKCSNANPTRHYAPHSSAVLHQTTGLQRFSGRDLLSLLLTRLGIFYRYTPRPNNAGMQTRAIFRFNFAERR